MVPCQDLRWDCDPARFPCDDTRTLEPIERIVGQERAVRALEFGLGIESAGYNLFVCGLGGSGRMSALRAHLLRPSLEAVTAPDRVYVHRFDDPSCPRLLTLPAGRGRELARSLERLIVALVRELHDLVRSDETTDRLQAILDEYQKAKRTEKERFVERLAHDGVVLFEVSNDGDVRAVLAAHVKGFPEPLTLKQIEIAAAEGRVPLEERDRLRTLLGERENELLLMLQSWARGEGAYSSQLEKERRTLCGPIVDDVVGAVREQFAGTEAEAWLEDLREAIDLDLGEFIDFGSDCDELPESLTAELRARFSRYRANVILEHTAERGLPVEVETQPSFARIFGGLLLPPTGEFDPDAEFLHLRAGALLAADGGILVMNASDLIEQPELWKRLLSVLRDGVLQFPIGGGDGFRISALRPDPIPIGTKVVLLGTMGLYQSLLQVDPEFDRIFKVRVDLEEDLPLLDDLIENEIPRLVARIVRDEHLLPVDRTGLARLVEAMVRLAPRRDRINAAFTRLGDLVREGTTIARANGEGVVTGDHIEAAVEARLERSATIRERAEREILDGTVRIASSGTAVGEVNAMVVRVLGEERYGLPVRISAAIGMGSSGVISIEREAGLSGGSHDKGMQILTGVLRSLYTRDFPLALAASLAIEQSYLAVDGDSATVAECLTLLSTIADVPLRQEIAVTGSLDQRGRAQAVGAVNEKIEGYFRICRARGFPEGCGALIPRVCIPQLMLRREVVEACGRGDFRVRAIESLDEAIEAMTGMVAGVRGEDERYPEESFHGRVEARLRALAEGLIRFRDGGC